MARSLVRLAVVGWTSVSRLSTAMLLLAACRATPSSKAGGAVDSSSGQPGSSPAAVVAGPEGSYDLLLPPRWQGHFRVDSLSTAERGRALPGALVFEYLPSDSTIRPQTLMALAVYDSATWSAVRAEPGPPPGDSVAAQRGRVYVIGLPQSNPFAPGSADATVFQVLQLRPGELVGLIRFR